MMAEGAFCPVKGIDIYFPDLVLMYFQTVF